MRGRGKGVTYTLVQLERMKWRKVRTRRAMQCNVFGVFLLVKSELFLEQYVTVQMTWMPLSGLLFVN